MSDALEYLLKTRPDAMKPYFKFLKEAGRRLDPKTRALISVITKVHAQTESGFRQYLSRALRDGATPDEVLDALLTVPNTSGCSISPPASAWRKATARSGASTIKSKTGG